MEIRAKVLGVCDLEIGQGKNGEWKRATVIVEYLDGDYPHKVALTNMRKADEFASLKVGDTGTFNINLNSREYHSRWYTTCDCWSWRIDAKQQSQGQERQPAAPQPKPTVPAQQAVEDDGGLPF